MIPNHDQSPVLERLNQLQQEYAQRLAPRVATIAAIWRILCDEAWDTDILSLLHRKVHGLAGSGATYGFVRLTTLTREIESMLQQFIEQVRVPTSEEYAHVTQLMNTIIQAYATPAGNTPGASTTIAAYQPAFTTIHMSRTTTALPETAPVLPTISPEVLHAIPRERAAPLNKDEHLIFLVEDDPDITQDLHMQISYFGYTVWAFANTTQLLEAIEQKTPAAIVMDIIFPESNMAGIEAIQTIKQQCPEPIPVIFISVCGDLPTRLQGVRAGGDAYLTKPVDVSAIIDKLDTLTSYNKPEPYRIIIIDDDVALAHYYETILQHAGITTLHVQDPLTLMEPLIEFRPDLLMMDVHMPGCTGLELASVIRQQEVYVGIPIVFISNEQDLKKHWDAMLRGGDDFLTKPVHPDHLLTVITSRAHRSRALRASMVRDSLTGLLNHTTTKEHLVREVALSQRRQSPLSFAMIDLDRFKSINDTYGHATGDRVIKSLSRVLRQRLRKTDIIGRYGGEEFAIMMPDTDARLAAHVLEQIRSGFAQIRQRAEEHEFSVTFSCGVASAPPYHDPDWLNHMADQALYRAKALGRNRVVLMEEA